MQPESDSVHSEIGVVAVCQRQPMKHPPQPREFNPQLTNQHQRPESFNSNLATITEQRGAGSVLATVGAGRGRETLRFMTGGGDRSYPTVAIEPAALLDL